MSEVLRVPSSYPNVDRLHRLVASVRQSVAKCSFICVVTLISLPSASQESQKFNLGVFGGFSVPISDTHRNLDVGWNVGIRGGLNIGRHLDADLDYSFSEFGLNPSALALFGAPSGVVNVWNLTVQPQWHIARRGGRVNGYATGGVGIYHRNLLLSRPIVIAGIICDPFFGCYPDTYTGSQDIALFTTVKPGFNMGPGLEFRLGKSRTRIFSEMRYQRMFTNHGLDITYIPVSFGLAW